MFQTKKVKIMLEETNSKLEQVQKEKKELELMKKLLEESYPKVDISNLYILKKEGNYFIVEKLDQPAVGKSVYFNKHVKCTRTLIIDIFTKKIIYDETYLVEFPLYLRHLELRPILSVEHSLLAFPDQKVPFYLLQQLFYKLNNISLEENLFVKNLDYNYPKK